MLQTYRAVLRVREVLNVTLPALCQRAEDLETRAGALTLSSLGDISSLKQGAAGTTSWPKHMFRYSCKVAGLIYPESVF